MWNKMDFLLSRATYFKSHILARQESRLDLWLVLLDQPHKSLEYSYQARGHVANSTR
jgi:hypothetical protein